MTLQAFGSFPVPPPTSVSGNTALLIDASGEKVGFTFRVGTTGSITALHFRLGTVTTGQTLIASLQDIDLTTGLPDGTQDQSGTVTVADTDDNTTKSVTLGVARSVTAGDYLAVVIEFNATVGNLSILANNVQETDNAYSLLYTASWAKQTRGPLVAVEYSGGVFYEQAGCFPITSASETWSNASTPDERGNIFSFAGPVEVYGASFYGRLLGNTDLVLYDSDGSTVLGTGSLDLDVVSSTGDGLRFAPFASPVSLSKATNYRIAIKPTTTTSTRAVMYTVSAAAHLDQLSGGAEMHYTSRTDAGSWTETTTKRTAVFLCGSKIDDAAGGGGGMITHPGMTGGLRG